MSHPQKSKSDDQAICEMFDSFVKTALRRKSRNLVRDYLRRAKHEQPAWDIEGYEKEGNVGQYDSVMAFEISVKGYVCTVYSEEVYQAFLSMDEKLLLVVILQYWENLRDDEIAEVCHISTRAVRKRRQKAILYLKEHMLIRGDTMSHAAGNEDHS